MSEFLVIYLIYIITTCRVFFFPLFLTRIVRDLLNNKQVFIVMIKSMAFLDFFYFIISAFIFSLFN